MNFEALPRATLYMGPDNKLFAVVADVAYYMPTMQQLSELIADATLATIPSKALLQVVTQITALTSAFLENPGAPLSGMEVKLTAKTVTNDVVVCVRDSAAAREVEYISLSPRSLLVLLEHARTVSHSITAEFVTAWIITSVLHPNLDWECPRAA